MEGHKRRDGTILCPSVSSLSGSLPSPPASLPPSPRSLPVQFRPAVIPEIVIPNDVGVYRRPNPNWVDPNPAPRLQLPNENDSDESSSVVSTILLDDGASIKTLDEDDEPTTDEEDDLVRHALGTSLPLASIFCTPKEDIAALRKAADEIGLHLGAMRNPSARAGGKLGVKRLGRRENSWWVVLGRNAECVRYLVDVQKRGMPGFYEPDKEEVVLGPSSSSLGFLKVVLAGAIGGAAVLFGMARIL